VLVILTDQPGLYSKDPRHHGDAKLISSAIASDPALLSMAGGVGTHLGRGGMITKVHAARRAARSGAHTAIVSGDEPNVLLRLIEGEAIGTRLLANTMPLTARKQWLTSSNKSLLPVGVVDVFGNFERGEVVSCIDQAGTEIARGLANYSAAETAKILRTPSAQIEAKLGYVDEPELIHRDNLVLL
jgi:glutamate 5-kinase